MSNVTAQQLPPPVVTNAQQLPPPVVTTEEVQSAVRKAECEYKIQEAEAARQLHQDQVNDPNLVLGDRVIAAANVVGDAIQEAVARVEKTIEENKES